MADRNTNYGSPKTKFPWNKERHLALCVKAPRPGPTLDSSYWRFINTGLDDFRGGYPATDTETPSEPHIGASPVISNRAASARYVLNGGRMTRHLSKQQACFSKLNVQQQMHRQYVVAVEEKLKQHPLALHPHFEQGMPPELFDQVISVLDPDMCVSKASSPPSPAAELVEDHKEDNCANQKEERVKEKDRREKGEPMNEINGESPKNPYIGLLRNKTSAKEDLNINEMGLHSLSQDEDIQKVTKLFCDWVNSLGGETTDITESTVLELFCSGFEKTPPQTFLLNKLKDPHHNYTALDRKHTNALLKGSKQYKSKPGNRKPIYGAWYLDPKTWKKRGANQPLHDPNVNPEEAEFRNQTSEKDEELKQQHGAKAFMQFIINKGLRVPKFLSDLLPEEQQEIRSREQPSRFGSSAKCKIGV